MLSYRGRGNWCDGVRTRDNEEGARGRVKTMTFLSARLLLTVRNAQLSHSSETKTRLYVTLLEHSNFWMTHDFHFAFRLCDLKAPRLDKCHQRSRGNPVYRF